MSATATGGRRLYRDLTPDDRTRTQDAYADLLDAARESVREGWRLPFERDALYAEARLLGVWIWPALADRIAKEARRTGARP